MPSLIDERVGDEYDGHCLYVGRCWSLMCTCVLYLICFLFGQLAFIHRKGELQILLLLCWWFANDIFDSNGPRKVTNACKIHYNYHLISDEYFLIWNPAILLLTVGLAQNISNIIVYLRCHCSYNEVSHIKSTINSWTGFVFQKSPLVHRHLGLMWSSWRSTLKLFIPRPLSIWLQLSLTKITCHLTTRELYKGVNEKFNESITKYTVNLWFDNYKVQKHFLIIIYVDQGSFTIDSIKLIKT